MEGGTNMGSKKLDIPKSLLETTLNTRDLGQYQSEISGKRLRLWSILRSDVQNYPSDNDISLLKKQNILTIIDMRGKIDVLRKPNGFADKEGFAYINIPIEEGSGVPESVDVVSDSYMNIAESKNVAQVFKSIASASSGVMINCTAGKDRTGVVSAVLLGICGVSEADIVADYMLTKTYNKERFELILKNFPDIDINIVIPSEQYMVGFIDLLKAKYGSFRNYLIAIGVTRDEIESIAAKLLTA